MKADRFVVGNLPIPVSESARLAVAVYSDDVRVAETPLTARPPFLVRDLFIQANYEPGEQSLTATLASTAEDIAMYVAGDGTDAQRLALADGIRLRWEGRPSVKSLQDDIYSAAERSAEAFGRQHHMQRASGVTTPDWDRWGAAVQEALRERYADRYFDDGTPAILSNEPARSRVVAADQIPLQAEDVAGLAAYIAGLEHKLARAEARLAQELLRTAKSQGDDDEFR